MVDVFVPAPPQGLVAVEAPCTDALLADGSVVTIRPIQPVDAAELRAFHEGLSPETQYRRFFSVHPHLSLAEAEHFTSVDHRDREALVVRQQGRMIGVGRYDRTSDVTATAEVAFTVADEDQGHGVGGLLLEHLASLARARGFHRLVASTLASNTRMREVFLRSGYSTRRTFDEGVIEVALDIDSAPADRSVTDRREREAEVASMTRLLDPAWVLVIGGDPAQDPLSGPLVDRLRSSFDGPVLAARHPAPLPEPRGSVGLAILTVASADVIDAVIAAGRSGAASVVVTAAGPADDVARLTWEGAVRTAARANGLRLVGPGSDGLLRSSCGLDALVGPSARVTTAGPVGVIAQSGTLARAILQGLGDVGIGTSTTVTVGAKADVSGNDLLQFWAEDPATEVAVIQLESFGNPHKFARLAHRISQRKPIVALRAGNLRADSQEWRGTAVLLRQHGVIDVETIDEVVDIVRLLVQAPLPTGSRVTLVADSHGLATLARHECIEAGLTPATDVRVVGGEAASSSVTSALHHPQTDAVVVLLGEVDGPASAEIGRRLAREAAVVGKPVLMIREQGAPLLEDGGEPQVPCFASVAAAMAALGHVTGHAGWRRRQPDRSSRPPGIDQAAARDVLVAALRARPLGGWLDLDRSRDLLGCYGIDVPRFVATVDRPAAVAAAGIVGWPVEIRCLEAQERSVLDIDLADRRGPLSSPGEVGRAWDSLLATNGPRALPMTVLPWGEPEQRLTLAVEAHRQVGSVLAADRPTGIGGPALRWVLPMGERAATAASNEVTAGVGGAAGAALSDLLIRVSCLVEDHPEVVGLGLDVHLHAEGSCGPLTGRVRVTPAPGPWDDARRHLRG